MTLRLLFLVGLLLAGVYLALGPRPFAGAAPGAKIPDAVFEELAPADLRGDTARVDHEHAVFAEAAQRAWRYVERAYQPATGLVQPVPDYAFATIWDVASTLAAFYAAERLGLITSEDLTRRVSLALRTLAELPLFDGAAFNKSYRVQDGAPGGRDGAASSAGYGWSAIDLGRLLVWLHILRVQRPELASAAEQVVARLDFDRLVRDGYLQGAELGRSGRLRAYQEGRIGYEQYAAAGFALWNQPASRATDWGENLRRVQVLNQALLQDRRPDACLTSEPFLLLGLELGWDEHAFPLALGLLGAQRERWRRTGITTVVSEDASADPPHYFHYYCALLDDVEFSVTAQGYALLPDAPRTISTKGAFAWYALAPNSYTRQALASVRDALASASGWPAGVYESNGRPAGPENVNTAAVILEAAAFARRRRPLLLER